MISKLKRVFLVLLVLSVLLLSACGGDTTDSGQKTNAEGEKTEQTSSETKAKLGTRENPIPIGQKAQVGPNWEVTILEIVPDAWSIIEAENMFNEPPEEGYQYVMAKVQFSYIGEESGTPWLDLSLRYLGSDGNSYSEGVGVVPKPFYDIGEQFPGATAEGNIGWAVPVDAVSGGRIIVEETFSLENTRVFFQGAQ